MSLPAASLSAFFVSSLRLLYCNLWRGVGEDGEAPKVGGEPCQRALTQKQTLLGRVAHFSEVTALSLSASHSLVMPSAA